MKEKIQEKEKYGLEPLNLICLYYNSKHSKNQVTCESLTEKNERLNMFE